jgi:LmbE family N-acetylglucosaminyl deacetylase
MTANLEGLALPTEAPSDAGARRALVIAAHPDDADFGAAGTAYLWSKQGWQFYYLVCTNGAKGSDDESITSAELIEMRRQEQRDAARLLGVQDCFFLDNEDGELTPNRAFLGDVVKMIRQLRPDAVFTHSDHRATGLTAVDAVYPAARDRLNFPEQIAAGLSTHKVSDIYIWGSERANFDVDITDAIDIKIEALRAHTSQFSGDFLDRARQRWARPDNRYVESFRRVQLS